MLILFLTLFLINRLDVISCEIDKCENFYNNNCEINSKSGFCRLTKSFYDTIKDNCETSLKINTRILISKDEFEARPILKTNSLIYTETKTDEGLKEITEQEMIIITQKFTFNAQNSYGFSDLNRVIVVTESDYQGNILEELYNQILLVDTIYFVELPFLAQEEIDDKFSIFFDNNKLVFNNMDGYLSQCVNCKVYTEDIDMNDSETNFLESIFYIPTDGLHTKNFASSEFVNTKFEVKREADAFITMTGQDNISVSFSELIISTRENMDLMKFESNETRFDGNFFEMKINVDSKNHIYKFGYELINIKNKLSASYTSKLKFLQPWVYSIIPISEYATKIIISAITLVPGSIFTREYSNSIYVSISTTFTSIYNLKKIECGTDNMYNECKIYEIDNSNPIFQMTSDSYIYATNIIITSPTKNGEELPDLPYCSFSLGNLMLINLDLYEEGTASSKNLWISHPNMDVNITSVNVYARVRKDIKEKGDIVSNTSTNPKTIYKRSNVCSGNLLNKRLCNDGIKLLDNYDLSEINTSEFLAGEEGDSVYYNSVFLKGGMAGGNIVIQKVNNLYIGNGGLNANGMYGSCLVDEGICSGSGTGGYIQIYVQKLKFEKDAKISATGTCSVNKSMIKKDTLISDFSSSSGGVISVQCFLKHSNNNFEQTECDGDVIDGSRYVYNGGNCENEYVSKLETSVQNTLTIYGMRDIIGNSGIITTLNDNTEGIVKTNGKTCNIFQEPYLNMICVISKKGKGIIAAIVIVSIVIIVVVSVGFTFLYKKVIKPKLLKKNATDSIKNYSAAVNNANLNTIVKKQLQLAKNNKKESIVDILTQKKLEEYGIKIVDIDEIKIERMIGKGGQATVYKGTYKGEEVVMKMYNLNNEQVVSSKNSKNYKDIIVPIDEDYCGSTKSETNTEDFMKNDMWSISSSNSAKCDIIKELMILGNLKNKNIMPVLGIVFGRNGCAIIMPYCKGGDLYTMTSNLILARKNKKLSSGAYYLYVLRVSLGICRALECLHNSHITHKDLKPQNILFLNNIDTNYEKFCTDMDGKFHVYLTDMGIAHLKSKNNDTNQLSQTENFAGTPLYVAPEMIVNRLVSVKSDCYSLGCIIFQLMNDNVHPLAYLKNSRGQAAGPEKIMEYVAENNNPFMPGYSYKWITKREFKPIFELVKRCWEPSMAKRPSAKELGDILQEKLDELLERKQVIKAKNMN